MQSCLAMLCVGRLGPPPPPLQEPVNPLCFPPHQSWAGQLGLPARGPAGQPGVVTEKMMNGWLRVSGLSCLSSCASLGIQCTGSDQLEVLTWAGKAGGGAGAGLIESVDVNLRGVLGWGREAMSMCGRSQESACAEDHSHLAERRCL